MIRVNAYRSAGSVGIPPLVWRNLDAPTRLTEAVDVRNRAVRIGLGWVSAPDRHSVRAICPASFSASHSLCLDAVGPFGGIGSLRLKDCGWSTDSGVPTVTEEERSAA